MHVAWVGVDDHHDLALSPLIKFILNLGLHSHFMIMDVKRQFDYLPSILPCL